MSVPIPTRAQSKGSSSARESSEGASTGAAPAVHDTLKPKQTASNVDSALAKPKTNSPGNANAPTTGDRSEQRETRTAEAKEGHHVTSPGETEGKRSSKPNTDEARQEKVQDPARQVTHLLNVHTYESMSIPVWPCRLFECSRK